MLSTYLLASLCSCQADKQASATGYYLDRQPHYYRFDRQLASGLGTFFVQARASSVLEIGSGPGYYLGALASLGIEVKGVDGNPRLFNRDAAVKEAPLGEPGHVRDDRDALADRDDSYVPFLPSSKKALDFALSFVEEHDVTSPLPHFWRFDWVLALEVAEHIPPEREADFLLNVHRSNAEGIIISWADRGMFGVGHVNMREPEEVRCLFASLGYQLDWSVTESLRHLSEFVWFKEQIFVFRRIRPAPRIPAAIIGWREGSGDSPFDHDSEALELGLKILVDEMLGRAGGGVGRQPDVNACCGGRENMLGVVRTSHYLACFKAIQASPSPGWCDYEHLCGANGTEDCLPEGVGFTRGDCCGPGSRNIYLQIWSPHVAEVGFVRPDAQ